MSEKHPENGKTAFRTVPKTIKSKDDIDKYMQPVQDKRAEFSTNELMLKLNDLTKQIAHMSSVIGAKIFPVNWLENWDYIVFNDNDSLEEIPFKQKQVEIWVRGLLADYVAQSGNNYTVTEFIWDITDDPRKFLLTAYLNPPAKKMGGFQALSLNVGDPVPQVNISPMNPKQPPPPYF